MGADAVLQVSGDDYLTLRAAHTNDRPAGDRSGGSDPDVPFDAAVGRVIWERRRSAGARYAVTAGWVGSRYSPGAGFVARAGVTDAAAAVAYTWFPAGAGNVARIDPLQFSTEVLIRHEDDVVESASLEYNFDIAWRSGIQASADVELQFEDVPAFELPNGTQVDAGRYTFATLDAGVESSAGGRARGEVDAVLGTFYDGWRGGLESQLSWNASRHFELAVEHEFNAVRFLARAQGFDSHVLRLRAGFARDTRASATVLAQYASVSGARGINLRLRYNFTEGHDLWLVLDEGLEGSPGSAPARRTLIIKYARTLIW